MNTYAQIKGRTNRPVPVQQTRPGNPVDLSDSEIERIARNREFVKQHLPELTDLIKALHAEGLIDGWRSVRRCALLREIEQ